MVIIDSGMPDIFAIQRARYLRMMVNDEGDIQKFYNKFKTEFQTRDNNIYITSASPELKKMHATSSFSNKTTIKDMYICLDLLNTSKNLSLELP